MRRHLGPPPPLEHVDDLLGVDGKVAVRVDGNTEEARVGLEGRGGEGREGGEERGEEGRGGKEGRGGGGGEGREGGEGRRGGEEGGKGRRGREGGEGRGDETTEKSVRKETHFSSTTACLLKRACSSCNLATLGTSEKVCHYNENASLHPSQCRVMEEVPLHCMSSYSERTS